MKKILALAVVVMLTGCNAVMPIVPNVQYGGRSGAGFHTTGSGYGTVYYKSGSQITQGSNGQVYVRVMR